MILGREEHPLSLARRSAALPRPSVRPGLGCAPPGPRDLRRSGRPGRGPRRHLLERPANSAAQLFPAFFHNDFLKLLTRIVPHFSAALPTPRPLRPAGAFALAAGGRPARTAPPTGRAPGSPRRAPAASAPPPAAARPERRGPERAPAARAAQSLGLRATRVPAPPAPPPRRPAHTLQPAAGSPLPAPGGTSAGLGQGLGPGGDSERGLERDGERGAPPPPPVARSRRGVPTATPGPRAQTLPPRGAGPRPPRAPGTAAGAGRTCWRRCRLQPAPPRRARRARRRHPRAQRAPALPSPPRFLIPAPHRARGSARPLVAGAQASRAGRWICHRAAGPALNPWRPGADHACEAAGTAAHSRGPSTLCPGPLDGAPVGRTQGPVKHFPQRLGTSSALQASLPSNWDHQAPRSWLRPRITSAQPRGVGKVDPPQVRGRYSSLPRQPMEYLPSLPSHLLRQKLGSRLPSRPRRARGWKGRRRRHAGQTCSPAPGSLRLSLSLREARSASGRRCG